MLNLARFSQHFRSQTYQPFLDPVFKVFSSLGECLERLDSFFGSIATANLSKKHGCLKGLFRVIIGWRECKSNEDSS